MTFYFLGKENAVLTVQLSSPKSQKWPKVLWETIYKQVAFAWLKELTNAISISWQN